MVTDGNTALWDELVLRSVTAAARKALASHAGYVELEDLQSEGYLWVAEHPDQVVEAVNGDRQQQSFLRTSLYRAMHKHCMRQRYLQDGTKPGDYFLYTPGILAELLPEALDGDDAVDSSPSDLNALIRASKPVNERGDRAAMVVDVQIGYASLDDDDQELIQLKFGDGGMTDERVAERLEVSQQVVNYRLHRALRRMGAALGGEPFEGRHAVSNARAQFVTRNQEG